MKKHFYKGFCWISASSLILSVLTFFIYVFRSFTFTNDAVIGVVTTLIGICATVMVGWQIFSSMQVRSELKEAQELIKKLEGKLSKVNSTIDEQNGKIENAQNISNELSSKLEQANSTIEGLQTLSKVLTIQQISIKTVMEEQDKKLEIEKNEREKQNKVSNAKISTSKAFAFAQTQLLTSYCHLIYSAKIYLELNDYDSCENIIKNIEVTLSIMNGILYSAINGDKQDLRKIDYYTTTARLLDNPEESPIEEMRKLPNYSIIKEKIELQEAKRKDVIEKAKELSGKRPLEELLIKKE